MTPRLISYTGGYESGKKTAEREYLVKTTEVSDGLAGAEAAVAAIPAPAGMVGLSLKGKPAANPLWFAISVGYQVPPWPDEEPNPLLRPSILTSTYEENWEEYFEDTEGTKVLNKAHDRFETFPQRRAGALCLQITKNIETFPAVAYDVIKYTRNDAMITIRGTSYDPKTLLLLPPVVSETFELVAGIKYHYYATTFRLLTDHLIHEHNIENRGYHYLDIDGKQQQIRLNARGDIPTTPYPLDTDGSIMPNASDAPTILNFKPYATAAWGLDFD